METTRNITYFDGSICDTDYKQLVVYFAILRMPDGEPELLGRDYVFTDDKQKLERRLRYEFVKEPHEAEHLEIIIRPVG